MIQQECIDELADLAGVGQQVKGITAKAMNGELDFEQALRARVALLKGQPASIIDQALKTRICFTAGGAELLATMKSNGAYTALVSVALPLLRSQFRSIWAFMSIMPTSFWWIRAW